MLLQECAQISAPTGGDRDETPPVLDSNGTVPLNYSTNFQSDKIVLTFDEYFVLKNPKANVFFSPSIENDPEFITKGKTLTVILNNQLKPNTTYTINFGDAISDYTVGNKIPDFKYVFSTGEFIDSMKTQGTIVNAYTGKPEEDILVLLYEDFSDSVVSKSKPVYYSKTDKQGNYTMSYIKAGHYKIMALKDENRNFLYDLPNEKIGYEDSLLNLTHDSLFTHLTIPIFTLDYQKQRVTTKKYLYPGKLVLGFLKPAESIQVLSKSLTPVTYKFMELSRERDSLILWKPNLANEKTSLTLKLDTTTEVINIYPFVTPKTVTKLKTTDIKRSFDKNQPFQITFKSPISSFIDSLITIKKDSNQLTVDSIQTDNRTLSIYFDKKEDDSYGYQLLSGAVTDIFGTSLSDTLTGYVSVRKADYYGSFTLKVKGENDSTIYLISLLNEKGDLIEKRTMKGDSELSFTKLEPGNYSIKAVEDRNSNEKWDTGDYYKKLKPETVYYFPTNIEVRSNWEMVESWEL